MTASPLLPARWGILRLRSFAWVRRERIAQGYQLLPRVSNAGTNGSLWLPESVGSGWLKTTGIPFGAASILTSCSSPTNSGRTFEILFKALGELTQFPARPALKLHLRTWLKQSKKTSLCDALRLAGAGHSTPCRHTGPSKEIALLGTSPSACGLSAVNRAGAVCCLCLK